MTTATLEHISEREKVDELIRWASKQASPPPSLTVSQWAERYRYVSDKVSGEPGKWRNDRTPYLVDIMNAVSDPRVETVVFMKCARIGGTEAINNAIGYHIHQDPCAMLYVQQTLEEGQKYSKNILKPMVEETPVLAGLVAENRSRDASSTIMHKEFPGGNIDITGANSPRGFRMVMKRLVIVDDVDGFESNVGDEGDPVALAFKRTATIWNKKKIACSSPSIKGFSRIEDLFEKSDKQFYNVPCPHCGERQTLRWGGKDLDYGIKWDGDRPETAYYLCAFCHSIIHEYQKQEMLRNGVWIATAPFRKTAGFHLNVLYSPWVTWAETVDEFLQAKDKPEQMQVWVNTALGETFEDAQEQIDTGALFGRREEYGPELPTGVAVLTAGVDVQSNRLEVEVEGWGREMENWGIEHKIIAGDPTQPEVWTELDKYLLTQWQHPADMRLGILCTAIDTGYLAEQAYAFIKPRQSRGVIAIKGKDRSESRKIISDRPSKKNKGKVNLYVVGTNMAKSSIIRRIALPHPGPGYCHWNMNYDQEWFDQLTAEKVITIYRYGFPRRIWKKKDGVPNEALDLKVYNLAALEWLRQSRTFNLENMANAILRRLEELQQRKEKTEEAPQKKGMPKMPKKNWVQGWRP